MVFMVKLVTFSCVCDHISSHNNIIPFFQIFPMMNIIYYLIKILSYKIPYCMRIFQKIFSIVTTATTKTMMMMMEIFHHLVDFQFN